MATGRRAGHDRRVDVVALTADSPAAHQDAWAALFRALVEEQLPELEPPGRAEALAQLTGDEERALAGLLAMDGDRPAGAVLARLPLIEDLDRADAALFVAEPDRRRGCGRRLFDGICQVLLDSGRRLLRGDAEAGTAGERFAAALGARETQRVVRSRLDLTAVDSAELAELTGRRVAGYRLVCWTGRCPDDLVDAFARAREAMNDAPLGDATRDPRIWDAARVRRWEEHQARRTYRGLVTAAVHEASGEVAGFTEIYGTGDRPRGVEQEDTAVVAAHRGHGLGLLVKAVNLRRLLDVEPHTRWVVTWNAADNRFMRAVNERLGFVVCAEELELELSLG